MTATMAGGMQKTVQSTYVKQEITKTATEYGMQLEEQSDSNVNKQVAWADCE